MIRGDAGSNQAEGSGEAVEDVDLGIDGELQKLLGCVKASGAAADDADMQISAKRRGKWRTRSDEEREQNPKRRSRRREGFPHTWRRRPR
jgi:hypothetical protein